MEPNQTKKTNSLTFEDIKEWIWQTFIFSIPAIVAGLNALAGGHTATFVLGAGYSALATSLMNLYGKYKAGI